MSEVKRRRFLSMLGYGGASFALPGFLATKGKRKLRRRPNIVLIMADDLGYECLSSYGSADYKTPRLDKLAGEGVRFNHCYSQPLCTPSRVKIMTGRCNFRNYYRFGYLDTEETTFGNIMRRNGYATAIVGKWQLGGDGNTVKHFGFDEHCLWHIQGRETRYWRPRIYENGRIRKDLRNKDTYGPDVFCDYAMNFMERKKDQPFFIYFPMALTHWPFDPTPDTETPGPKKKGTAYGGQGGAEHYFDDMVSYMDKIVGRLAAKLEELGLRENTLFMFTGDNGTFKGIKSKMEDGRVIRGGKGIMDDSGTRVPLIVSCPGRVPGGRVTDALVDFSDFFPTIAEAGGARIPGGFKLDGKSFYSHLLGKTEEHREWILCDYNPRPPKRPKDPEKRKRALEAIEKKRNNHKLGRWIRNQRYKLYANGGFYNVEEDVLEKHSIPQGSGAAEAERIRKKFQKVLDSLAPWKPFMKEK